MDPEPTELVARWLEKAVGDIEAGLTQAGRPEPYQRRLRGVLAMARPDHVAQSRERAGRRLSRDHVLDELTRSRARLPGHGSRAQLPGRQAPQPPGCGPPVRATPPAGACWSYVPVPAGPSRRARVSRRVLAAGAGPYRLVDGAAGLPGPPPAPGTAAGARRGRQGKERPR